MSIENIKPGSYISLSRGHRLAEPVFANPFRAASNEPQYDRSYVGSVLLVRAVQLPLIACEELVDKCGLRKTGAPQVITINSSECRVVLLDDDFVAAKLGGEQ